MGKPSRLPTVLEVEEWQELFKKEQKAPQTSKPVLSPKIGEIGHKKSVITGKITLSP